MKRFAFLVAIVIALASSNSCAQFANGVAGFSILPNTQANGPVVDNLSVSAIPNGLVVSGTWSVTVPPGAHSGILLAFEAERLMQTPAYGPPLITTLSIPGTDFISRPIGNLTASGAATAGVDNFGASSTGFSFPNTGPGTYFYNNGLGFVTQSSSYTYTGGANQYLRVNYFVDFNYSGPGGTYTFNFPLTAELVPEPTSMAVCGVFAFGLLVRRRGIGVR